MIEKSVVIQNKYGLHARPAAQFVEVASRYAADINIEKDGVEVNGKSIMGVLMLAAEKGSELTLRTDGEDEQELLDELVDLLLGKLDKDN